MKKTIIIITIAIFAGIPTLALGGAFTSSLIQGKSPAESIDILAGQIDAIFGRVEHIESQQSQSDKDINAAQLEIERLRLENENLKLETAKIDSETKDIRIEKSRHDRCAELGKQIGNKEADIRAPYLERINSLRKEYIDLKAISKGRSYSKILGTPDIESTEVSVEEAAQAEEKAKTKQAEINTVNEEMDQAIKLFLGTPEIKNLIEEADKLLCA